MVESGRRRSYRLALTIWRRGNTQPGTDCTVLVRPEERSRRLWSRRAAHRSRRRRLPSSRHINW
ncbi:hypothetical protein PJP10_20560 [Mycobacterium kansasii]